MRLFAAVLIVVALAACGYDPPPQVDARAPAYAANLEACRDSASTEVNTRNAKTGLAWFASPVRRWGQIRDTVQTCMAGKGYGSLRTCTEDELRAGSKSSTLVVTAEGIKCTEPPTPERRRAG